MTLSYHKEQVPDHEGMLAMRAVLAVHPALEFGSEN